ncbi:MAG: pirin family protein [Bacteroidota bacterium]
MKRKDFFKVGMLATAGLAIKGVNAEEVMTNNNDELKPLLDNVGFNHMPQPDSKLAGNMVLHKADTRGGADWGWLQTKHSFSFANYYNPDRMNFGVLRVLNDDIIAAGRGFSMHPHDNMEIVTIPHFGALEHKDSMGNGSVIQQYDLQHMSAGTGIYHSEFNPNKDLEARIFQIWVFPKESSIKPKYHQRAFEPKHRINKLQTVVSPDPEKYGGIYIHQDAWFTMGKFKAKHKTKYTVQKGGNGVYVFMMEGNATINGQVLNKRDGFGIWDIKELSIQADSDCEILLMDVPMQIG